MFHFWRVAASRFHNDDRGSVAIIFGLASVTLLIISGVAIDYSRLTDMRERVSFAVDAASLAAGRAMAEGQLSDAEVIALAQTYFTKNSENAKKMGSIGTPTIALDRLNGTVKIDVAVNLDTTISRIGGVDHLAFPVSSTSTFKQRDVEVGMALDITGSMGERINGETKINSLKVAFEKFADKLMPDANHSTRRVRIGLAPYSAAINLGTYAGVASSNKSKDGCVTERKAGGASDDEGDFYVKADGSRSIDQSYSYQCPAVSLTALSDSRDDLVRTVNSYALSASTGGHFGAQWAWNLVSDKWAGVFTGNSAPDSLDKVKEDKLVKAVVLMTDGEFNTAYHGGKSSTQAEALCKEMKAQGVLVFAVGFGLGSDPTAISTLQNCATPGSGYFANAANGQELEAAFERFAGKLSELRLSQ